MNDLDKHFQHPPEPDEQAQDLAIERALAHYRQLHEGEGDQVTSKSAKFFQGLRHWLRPRGTSKQRSYPMAFRHRTLIAGFASAGVVLVGLFVVLPGIVNQPLISDDQMLQDIPEAEVAKIGNREDSLERLTARKEVQAMYMDAPSPQKPESRAQSQGINMAAAPILEEAIVQPKRQGANRDRFTEFDPGSIKVTQEEPVSTFSIDVDTASYSFVRRQLNQGSLPAQDAVRAEEMINYFDYDYPLPAEKDEPFEPSVSVIDSPWSEGRKLVHIGIKGYQQSVDDNRKTNLVFLLDVSGSMNSPDKLPLVVQSMEMLLSSLKPDDTVAIAVYAGAAGTVLEPTEVREREKILAAMRSLSAGGSTAGAEGIELAYQLAEQNLDKQAVSRVILATDGDFNVGINNVEHLKSYIERKRDSGVYLSVLGFGQGNYNDHLMQTLAQNGNGIAAYIDTLSEAQKVLVHQAHSTLFPIAKDVKIQVEFNPAAVREYRLIGYETRQLNREDFNNDKVDAGDIGAGHSVTAIYEITPTDSDAASIDPLRYADETPNEASQKASEYGFLKIRYKLPDQTQSRLISAPISKNGERPSDPFQRDINFAVAVAAFAQYLSGGEYIGEYSLDAIIELAQANKGPDPYGYRTEFVQLVRRAKMASDL